MDKTHVPIYLPKQTVDRVDVVAHDEMRSRANAANWLITAALRDREPAGVVEPQEVTG